MRRYIIKVGTPNADPGRANKVWLPAGFATEMDDGNIICTLTMRPVGEWDGQFKLFPRDQETETNK